MIVAVVVTATVPPVTVPFVPLTAAIPLALLLHVPPAGAEFNTVVDPEHTLNVPVIVAGFAFTVTGILVRHPVPSS